MARRSIVDKDYGMEEMMDSYKRMRVLFCDHLNLPRGKYLPQAVAKSGSARFCISLFGLTHDRELTPVTGAMMLEGLPDLEAVFDPDDVRPSWEDDTGIVLADLQQEGSTLPTCGRSLLKRTIAQFGEKGLSAQVGIELEAFIFQRGDDGTWVPYDTPGAFVYGSGQSVDPAGLIDDIWHQAERCNLPIESLNSEYDWPQFELTLKYSDALSAIDNIFLFKVMAKETLAKRGYLLSFMPKPLSDRGGSGLHVNFSFNDSKGGNALADPDGADGISDLARQCIAGLMQHHEGMAALLAPTVNSYRRLRPASLSGYWANWGLDHRGTTVRIPGERGAATRIEHRIADCASNPYVTTATVLQAARLGIDNGYELPPVETGDCFENINTERCVPENLGAALAALRADQALVDAVGPDLVANFCEIKEVEWGKYLAHTTDWELDYYQNFV
jgi:glutamine synthetase